MSRLSNSWTVMKASAQVLRQHPEFLAFPLMSGVAAVVVAAAFVAPIFVAGGGWDTVFTFGGEHGGYLRYAYFFVVYLALYTVTLFFNTALVGAAVIRLEGGEPTVRDGLAIAIAKLPVILQYATIAATVGVILRAIEERASFVGRIVVGFIGLAWTLATYLIVPVLVVQNVSAIEAVRESARLFKQTWGERVVAHVGMGLVFFLIFLLGVALGVPLMIGAASVSPQMLLVAAGALGGTFVVLVLAASALHGIYSVALYRFAAAGDPGEYFDAELMQSAFRPKGNRA